MTAGIKEVILVVLKKEGEICCFSRPAGDLAEGWPQEPSFRVFCTSLPKLLLRVDEEHRDLN